MHVKNWIQTLNIDCLQQCPLQVALSYAEKLVPRFPPRWNLLQYVSSEQIPTTMFDTDFFEKKSMVFWITESSFSFLEGEDITPQIERKFEGNHPEL